MPAVQPLQQPLIQLSSRYDSHSPSFLAAATAQPRHHSSTAPTWNSSQLARLSFPKVALLRDRPRASSPSSQRAYLRNDFNIALVVKCQHHVIVKVSYKSTAYQRACYSRAHGARLALVGLWISSTCHTNGLQVQ